MDFKSFALLDKPDERKKREEKAASAGCTPYSIDRDGQSGTFGGSSGKYNTWLSECECVDFKRRHLPCKHMYRLAHELGLYDLGSTENDPDAIREARRKVPPRERAKAVEECIALIDGYDSDVQHTLQSVLSAWYGKMIYVCDDRSMLNRPLSDGLVEVVDSPATIIKSNTQKRTVDGLLAAGFEFPPDVKTTKKARYEWSLEHPDVVCACVYPDCIVVRPSEKLDIAYMKVYSYLNRKFEGEYDDFS